MMTRGQMAARVLMVGAIGAMTVVAATGSNRAEEPVIPHGQSEPPGPALSPQEAVAAMTVPEGFRVELVASEPEIVNPVAMTFDEQGRIWITESLEYPRREAGPGRDRVKVLEDTTGDGTADRVTVFADGLNIPSGIAVGHGGVWVANAPDILFMQDTTGDGRADQVEVVVTGFGRIDTHELPNSLTWGPDGWLYGWNGVFNPSKVTSNNGTTYEFTCAIFCIHPKTREFQIFCEGTSNPWGIAIDPEGSLFASACVIDHLWHLTETGYYIRQGGPYPPFTWPIGSIVDHRHQQAAYCGLHYFDSDAYPPEYRDRLYMGNIHGNCINVDVLQRDGATYHATAAPDFLAANDAWFMPVVQKTGPDGCLYILDWYDRYHCYQDANRDPEGIDRSKGRLYRVRYNDTPRAPRFNLAEEDDNTLIERLHSPNVYFRDIAQRLLTERLMHGTAEPETRETLEALVLDDSAPRKARMHGLWALVGSGSLDAAFHESLLTHDDPSYRAWGVRTAGNMGQVPSTIQEKVRALAEDESPDVALQVVIAARKVEDIDALPVLLDVLARHGDDRLIPHIVWENLHPILEDGGRRFVAELAQRDATPSPGSGAILSRAVDRILGSRDPDPAPITKLVGMLALGEHADEDAAQAAFTAVARQVQRGQIAGDPLDRLREHMRPVLEALLSETPPRPLVLDAMLMAASWNDPAGRSVALGLIENVTLPESQRLRALETLVAIADPHALDTAARVLADRQNAPAEFRARVLATLGSLDDPGVARIVLDEFPRMEPELKPRAIELLTQRPSWSLALLETVRSEAIPADAVHINQIRNLSQSPSQEIRRQVEAIWGTVREERSPEREQVINRMRAYLRDNPGDPFAGIEAFQKACAQCHTIYGEGQDVGPDLTGVGRSDFEQLLSNVFDPSLVIGPGYQATTVATTDGRVLTGLLVEDSDRRIVLKIEGGEQETIPRAEVDEVKVSAVSLMPEDLETQLSPQEIADLFAFLLLDRHPSDPEAKPVPGAPAMKLGGRAPEGP